MQVLSEIGMVILAGVGAALVFDFVLNPRWYLWEMWKR